MKVEEQTNICALHHFSQSAHRPSDLLTLKRNNDGGLSNKLMRFLKLDELLTNVLMDRTVSYRSPL